MTNAWGAEAERLFAMLGRLLCQRDDLDGEIERVRSALRALNATAELADKLAEGQAGC